MMAGRDSLIEVILYVENMPAQVAFYRDVLGLTVREPAPPASFAAADWVTFDTGPCTLALHSGGRRRLGEDAPKIVFQVDDLPGARAALMQKGVAMSPPRTPAPEVWVSDGRDPEGNPFSIESRPVETVIARTRPSTAPVPPPSRRIWTV